ncbi:hypothetical protein YYC_04644 [Plasmodium yoelii 17X]|nr:conserved protein, unknown function [Plasmodium yoelii]ETB57842.1 hypothetical protein YYC_04644 [Plasmodium yoelii 17X]CDU18118.1 conserved Plasmodium protein, unknown function [Plasmodium yoelii]VTZ78535.1 conserved protein, unknown function [Plasmodium yoelii]|eukprot:XP_022812244.1 conserved protein, unknown function [Plasmodium yoelii]
MNLTIKIINFFFYYLIIEPYLFSESLGSIKSSVVFATLATGNIPNGPVDLPSKKKLNLGLRKYRYNIPDENVDNVMQSEMNEDAKELMDDINKMKYPDQGSDNYYFKNEMYYEIPPWLQDIITLSNKSKKTLETLGIENLPDVNACKSIKNLQEQMLCTFDALEDIKEVYHNAKEITSLTARVLAGGRLAIKSLGRLKSLASRIENKQLMKKLGTPMATLILLQRETTSDRNRWICGSILTMLTDLPVVSDLADVKTGSYGHVNVIIPRQSRVKNPDRVILKLREGISPSNLINGFATSQ